MRYDKQNRKILELSGKLALLEKQNADLKTDAANTKEILNNTLHEIRRFSAQISKFCEKLSRDTTGQKNLNQTALSAFYTAGMISSRLAYTDIELNPRAIESQIPIRSGIFKKFDKAKRILAEEAKNKSVNVSLIGESRTEIETLPVFELLPFVIIENAIKYSPPNQGVDIIFESYSGKQLVTIKSQGPDVTKDELQRIFDKGFRGASTRTMPGEGLGLFLAKRVCEFHGISICAEVRDGRNYTLNGVRYCEFLIIIKF
ncbi:ATP-binding protein [Pseudacidovorax intermedius]|uniref:ATP-binding protein n=1 Tax=Pseudacidovorax intermedius TaxID=433924 RepID=UPI0009DC100F|nr:HAMP domain-containing sensor histidine kinase [Pseudacidovorax intermedius]